jgi:small nuclear ribonucleoprotein (snRNP)-like protein
VGYDQFMNIVLGETTEEVAGGDDKNIGMVVSVYITITTMS